MDLDFVVLAPISIAAFGIFIFLAVVDTRNLDYKFRLRERLNLIRLRAEMEKRKRLS